MNDDRLPDYTMNAAEMQHLAEQVLTRIGQRASIFNPESDRHMRWAQLVEGARAVLASQSAEGWDLAQLVLTAAAEEYDVIDASELTRVEYEHADGTPAGCSEGVQGEPFRVCTELCDEVPF